MNLTRFTQIIDAYGSRPEHWPEVERQTALALISQSAEAKLLLNEASKLDSWLDSGAENKMNFSALNTRILIATAPETTADADKLGLIDSLLDWLLPVAPSQFWRPLAGATFTLALGIMVGLNSEFVSQDPTEAWDDEITMMAMDITAVDRNGDSIND